MDGEAGLISGGIRRVPIPDSAISLDMTRIYRDAYQRAGRPARPAEDEAARAEAAEEFAGEDGEEW